MGPAKHAAKPATPRKHENTSTEEVVCVMYCNWSQEDIRTAR